nr:immunoglobulin light chain junction region [Macaca mulatta]
CQQYDSDTLTF